MNKAMQCLENDGACYKGEIINMFGFPKKKNNHDAETGKNDESNEKVKLDDLYFKIENLTEKLEKNNSKKKLIFISELGSFILLLLTAFGGAFAYLNTQFNNINESIDNCLTQEDIKELETSVNEIELWVKGDINDINKPGANKRIEKIEEMLKISPIYVNSPTVASTLLYTTSMENQVSTTSITFTSETYLGEGTNGEKYSLGDIVGEKVLLTYNEDNKEVYFLGQLNSQYHWDGYCVTNTYNNNGTLYGICESNFDNGKRLDYESFYISDTDDVWIHTDRICTKDGNQGISEKYSFKYNSVKNFTLTNARIYDFLYVEDFSGLDDKTMLTYYNGLTSNGTYNDPSGDAYEIIFNSDGTVKILYMGQFSNGCFHDTTGQAKEIVFDSSNNINRYFYYNGKFEDGVRKGKVSSNDYVTQDQINDILKDKKKKLDIELKWYGVDDTVSYVIKTYLPILYYPRLYIRRPFVYNV